MAKKCYIAGPMRGIEYFNFPAFDAAESALTENGWTVINPAEMDRRQGFDPTDLPDDYDWSVFPHSLDFSETLNRDLGAIMEVDAVFVLENWEKSKGASAEVSLAWWRGIPVLCAITESEIPFDSQQGGTDQSESPLAGDAAARKGIPLYSGLLKYFPDALVSVARLSQVGNDQHNPGQPLHWDRSKSADHHDCLMRHLFEAGEVDGDGIRHSAKVAWRALAALQLELEGAA